MKANGNAIFELFALAFASSVKSDDEPNFFDPVLRNQQADKPRGRQPHRYKGLIRNPAESLYGLFHAEIGFLHHLVLLQRGSGVGQDDLAGLHDVAAIRDAQRQPGILLD